MKKANMLLWFVAILIFSTAILFITFLIASGTYYQDVDCSGDCEAECEDNEDWVEATSCTFYKPQCCVDFEASPDDDLL